VATTARLHMEYVALKGKVLSVHVMKAYGGKQRYSSTHTEARQNSEVSG
jgi:hypothetical protein